MRSSSRDHLQIRDVRQLRQNFILDAIGKVGVFFFAAQVFKRQNGDALLRNVSGWSGPSGFDCRFSWTARPAIALQQLPAEQCRGDERQRGKDRDELPFAPLRQLLGRGHVCGPLHAFGSHLECPGNHERNRKTDDDENDDGLCHPFWRVKHRQHGAYDLNDEPTDDPVGDGNLVNVAALQLGNISVRPFRCRPIINKQAMLTSGASSYRSIISTESLP